MPQRIRRVRRIGVLDPVAESRKFTYQVIQRLGHLPVGFTHFGGLQVASGYGRDCDMLLVTCVWDVGMAIELLSAVRELLGPRMPLIFMARADLVEELRARHCHASDTLISVPSTFIEFRNLLRLIARRISPTEARNKVRPL